MHFARSTSVMLGGLSTAVIVLLALFATSCVSPPSPADTDQDGVISDVEYEQFQRRQEVDYEAKGQRRHDDAYYERRQRARIEELRRNTGLK